MEKITIISEELRTTTELIPFSAQKELAMRICSAGRVFIAGAGRSGLMARCFAMRLMHMGFQVSMVGDVTTPSIKKGDLLIIASGSGTTTSLVAMANKAKSIGADIATITIYEDAPIAQIASIVIPIPAPTAKSDVDMGFRSVQPMGSLFEQSLLVCLDYVILILMDLKQITAEEMFARHANLE